MVSLELGDNLTMTMYTFQNCDSLTSLKIGNGTIFDYPPFSDCNGLQRVVIKGDVGSGAFVNCDSLRIIELGEGANIGGTAFRQCGIVSLTIPENVTLGDKAFSVCESLETVFFEGAATLGEGVFENDDGGLDPGIGFYGHGDNFNWPGMEQIPEAQRGIYYDLTITMGGKEIGTIKMPSAVSANTAERIVTVNGDWFAEHGIDPAGITSNGVKVEFPATLSEDETWEISGMPEYEVSAGTEGISFGYSAMDASSTRLPVSAERG
jgi:hypothetical protein